MTEGQVLSDAEQLPETEPGVEPPSPPQPPPPNTDFVGPSTVPEPGPGDRYTSLSPDMTMRQLGQWLQVEGWTVAFPAPGRYDLTLNTPGNPNMLIGIILLLICVIPGIIYFVLTSQGTVLRASLFFIPHDSGTRIAFQASPQAMQRLGRVLVMLPW